MQNEELRCSQHDLAESRARYMELYEMAPVGYVTLDGDHVIREVNLRFCKMVGLDRREVIGRRFTHFVAPKHQDDCYLHLYSILQFEAEDTMDVQMLAQPDDARRMIEFGLNTI